MLFIGDFSLQNVKTNFQRQTKKKMFDVSLSAGSFALTHLNSASVETEKRHFYF